MTTITYIELTPGISIVNSSCKVLGNTVNCKGAMGKGVALAFKQHYPTIMVDYKDHCDNGVLLPGQICPWHAPDGKLVLNCATNDDFRAPSSMNWITDILCKLSLFDWEKYHLTSLALPPLGCGEGKLNWSEVGPLMAAFLEQIPLERIEVYIPVGAPQYHL